MDGDAEGESSARRRAVRFGDFSSLLRIGARHRDTPVSDLKVLTGLLGWPQRVSWSPLSWPRLLGADGRRSSHPSALQPVKHHRSGIASRCSAGSRRARCPGLELRRDVSTTDVREHALDGRDPGVVPHGGEPSCLTHRVLRARITPTPRVPSIPPPVATSPVSQKALAVVTAIWLDWIERVFGIEPDQGSGALEWFIVAVVFAISVGFALAARLEWRRALRAEAAS